jgi:hypothetical protein
MTVTCIDECNFIIVVNFCPYCRMHLGVINFTHAMGYVCPCAIFHTLCCQIYSYGHFHSQNEFSSMQNYCIYVENSSHVQNYSQWIQSHTLCIIYIRYQFHPHGHVFDWYELVSILYSMLLIDNWISLSSMSISLIICMCNPTWALCRCALPIMITWWQNKLILGKLRFYLNGNVEWHCMQFKFLNWIELKYIEWDSNFIELISNSIGFRFNWKNIEYKLHCLVTYSLVG